MLEVVLALEIVEVLETELVGTLNRLRAVASEPELAPVAPVAPLVPVLPDADVELPVEDVPEVLVELLLLAPGPRRLPRIWGASREVKRSGEVLPASRRVRSNLPDVTRTVRTDTSAALPGGLPGASDRACQSRPDPATKATSRSVHRARLRFISDCIADLPDSIHTNPGSFQRE